MTAAAAAIPEVSTPEMKALLADVLEKARLLILGQAKAAVATLAAASEKAGKEGAKLLSTIAEVALERAEGKISSQAADTSTWNLLEALELRGRALTNEAQADAFRRGVALMGTLRTVALSLLEMALQVAVPGAVRLVEGLVDRAAGAGKGEA